MVTVREARGTGSIRERTPGVWEIRIVVGFDSTRRRSVQRSFTFRGSAELAQQRRRELVTEVGASRLLYAGRAASLTLGGLLTFWLHAPHLWKHATVVSHSHVVAQLEHDPVTRRRLVLLTATDMTRAVRRWQQDGISTPKISARWLVIRSALSFAVAEGLLRTNALTGVRGPARPRPRRHHTLSEVRQLLASTASRAETAMTAMTDQPTSLLLRQRAFRADQDHLLVRLAADSGARRGELAVLRHSDLDDRILTIARGLSAGVLGNTKSGRTRRMTLGATTAQLINRHIATWNSPQAEGDWLFAPTPARADHLTADALSHRFSRIGLAAGIDQPALHRLRHGLATHLVDTGKLLKAQARLGHHDPATTLRHYSHATPLDDQNIADDLDRILTVIP